MVREEGKYLRKTMKDLKYTVGYCVSRSEIRNWYEGIFASLRMKGWDVEGFCVTIDPPGPRFSYPELDKLWHARDRQLLEMYDSLHEMLMQKDVFI